MSIDLNESMATTARVRDTCLCLHVQRAARVLARRFDEALRPVGLTHGQFSLLNGLNRPGPTPRAAILSLLSMDRTTLTAVAKPLVRRGLVVEVVNPKDRRSRFLSITPAGRELLAVAMPIWTETHAEIEQGLEPKAPPRLRADLDRLAQRRRGATP